MRILADDLTGALDCAAAFGAGVPVHLGDLAGDERPPIEIVATASRDVAPCALPALLNPCLPWLRAADVAFKKVDSLLRGNTFDEVDWLARQGGFTGLALVPGFPAQGRVTEDGQQWWLRPNGERTPVSASIRQSLLDKGWSVESGPVPSAFKRTFSDIGSDKPKAWVPDVRNAAEMNAVAEQALNGPLGVLWCGSAGLAQALAQGMSQPVPKSLNAVSDLNEGALMLVSASHHAVTAQQWDVLKQSRWAPLCCHAQDPNMLAAHNAPYPVLIDLAASTPLTQTQAAQLLAQQVALIAQHAQRPRILVVIGGDTLLALCQALGATGLRSELPLSRPGWGCAQMLGGRWDGLVCHTRSGAFGTSQDLLQVVNRLGVC